MGSLSLRPGDSLTIPRMALSVGFIRFVSSTDATQATGLLTLALVGLTRCGRDAVNPAPPAQNRTCRITAYGSYLGCLASKRRAGSGWRIVALGIQQATSDPKRSQVIRLFWPRR